jgi:hypothetical protein
LFVWIPCRDSNTAGLAWAHAAHELGLRPVVIEKASTLGGGTVLLTVFWLACRTSESHRMINRQIVE